MAPPVKRMIHREKRTVVVTGVKKNGPVGTSTVQDPWRQVVEGELPPPSAPSAPAPPLPYYLEHLPPILKKKQFPFGAAVMEWWLYHGPFTRPLAEKDSDKGKGYRCPHRTRVLNADFVKSWKNCKNYPLQKLQEGIPFFLTGNWRKDLIKKIYDRWKEKGKSAVLDFPEPEVFQAPPLEGGNPNWGQPTKHHEEWCNRLDYWGFWAASDGAGAWQFIKDNLPIVGKGFDDLHFALGNFSWWFVPVGQAKLYPAITLDSGKVIPEEVGVQLTGVGIYAWDTFDFDNYPGQSPPDQPLGIWNVDTEDISTDPNRLNTEGGLRALKQLDLTKDARYKPNADYTYVTNDAFNQYRREANKGHDFELYSDVKKETIPLHLLHINPQTGLEYPEYTPPEKT
jgi:hypothetical protein